MFVPQAFNNAFYVVPEFTVQRQIDTEEADMMYVVEVTEPRTSGEPSRMRHVYNVADHEMRHNAHQLP